MTTKANGMKAYAAMLAESKAVGWPRQFEADLTKHDRGFLEVGGDEQPYLWALRVDGTCLYAITESRIDRTHFAWDMPALIDHIFGEAPRFYVWDGKSLRGCLNAAHAREEVRRLAGKDDDR